MAKKRKRRTYGTGSITQRGNVWTIRFREANGRRRTRSFATRELAERVLQKILGQIAVEEAGLPPDVRNIPTLTELFQPWIEARQHTHRSWRDDRSRWKAHVGPWFGTMRPGEVTADEISKFVDTKVASGTLSSTSVGHLVRLLSTFMADAVEDPANGLTINPVRTVRKATRKKYRTAKYDAPFIERREDIRRVFLALPEPYNVMFACGVMLGLRTAEVIGIDWQHIDLAARRVRVTQQIQDGRITPLKDGDPRSVPVQDDLLPILTAWKVQTGGRGLLFTPKCPTRGGRPDLGRPPAFIRQHTVNLQLRRALAACNLPSIGWRHATRTTFGSHHVLAGGSLEELRLLLGHEDQKTTQRYAKLRVDLFPAMAYSRVRVDFSQPEGSKVLPMVRLEEIGRELGSDEGESRDRKVVSTSVS